MLVVGCQRQRVIAISRIKKTLEKPIDNQINCNQSKRPGAAEPTAALVGIPVAGRRDIDGLIEMCSCSNFDFQI